MNEVGIYVVAGLIVGFVVGFAAARASRRWANKHNARVIGMVAVDERRSPDLAGQVELAVAVPVPALRRTRIGDTITVVLR
jgi:hypothetical protein